MWNVMINCQHLNSHWQTQQIFNLLLNLVWTQQSDCIALSDANERKRQKKRTLSKEINQWYPRYKLGSNHSIHQLLIRIKYKWKANVHC